MNDFNRCNKVTGVHWLKKPVRDIQIKINLKPQDGILSLPKFEDYTNDSHSINLQKLENQTEEYIFKWQEKVFSGWELHRYSDPHNCINDTELSYHDMIKDLQYEPSKIFTYVHNDYHLALPSDLKIAKENKILSLSSCFEKLNIGERVERILGGDSSSMRHLFRSEEDVGIEKEQWTAMHVVFDNSDYNEDSQLVLKQEATLLSIYHNTAHDYLIVCPDVNHLDLNPYTVETATAVPLGYQYAVEMEFGGVGAGDDLGLLLRKLHKKWEKKQRLLLSFVMPPLGRKQYYVALEILSATGFDMDCLYIEYNVKVPESIQCSDSVHGRTHTSLRLATDENEEWLYGHMVELHLETAAGAESHPLHLFLEVISSDWWGRHRTEGYTCLPLTLEPGRYHKQLSCSRPEELDDVEAESRRFFVGGCHLIKDLEILAKPQLQDANFKYVTTGTISLQWTVISQSHAGSSATPSIPSISSASAVLLGAEAALRKYRKARARLAAATREMEAGDG